MVRKHKIKKPVVIFCELRRPADEIINISSQNGAESVVTRMLPKSHVSHVILNANVSEERFLDMKVSTESKMQKKSLDVHDHFINTFVKRLERKQQRWMKEDEYVSKNLQLSATGRQKSNDPHQVIGAFSLPTPEQTPAEYKKAKYPYVSINRIPKHENLLNQKNSNNLPRIQTVPAGKSRPPQTTTKQVKLPAASHTNHGFDSNNCETNAWIGNFPTTHRAESASTVATRMTGYARRKPKSMRNYDMRFTELMNFLSPKNALEGPAFRRPKMSRNVMMFGVSQTSV